MADFVEYANGAADTPWGRKRVADGHPEPYRLTHIELGNEEAVNENYWRLFQPMAEAIWGKDPGVILVVGDFAYGKVIDDPFRFEGGAVVNTLAAHKKILELAKRRGREVWFDIHISTDHPPQPNNLRPERSYIAQLERLAPGAPFKVAIFEFNSGNHAMKRALSNACAINAVQRVGGRIPVACSANCLQPDGQNDNGWDQGLLFLNPSRVWLQPPGYVTRMVARHDRPVLVAAESTSPGDALDVTATRDEDGKALVLKVVNTAARPVSAELRLSGFRPKGPEAAVETLSGPPEGVNTAEQPERFKPETSRWRHGLGAGRASYTFPAHSFTVVRFESS
jgi:alpha-L-arabinofuranosidase